MKKLFKICVVFLVAFTFLSVGSNQTIYANQANVDNAEVQEFIDRIARTENRTIMQDEIVEYTVENEVVTIIIKDNKDGFSMYRSLSDEEQETMQPSTETRGIIKTIWGVIKKIISGGKAVCKLVEVGTGEDVCGMIGRAMLETLATNVRYKVISYLVKDPNCNPPHSQQCNMAPYVYWKTSVQIA